MRVAEDGVSIDITEKEILKLGTLGFVVVRDCKGKVIEIKQPKKTKKEIEK